MDHNKLWKILQEMGIPDHLICLLRNLYAGQEATVRTGHGITDHLTCLKNGYAGQEAAVRARHGTTDWIQIEKGIHQGCVLSPCLFNGFTEYIM